MNCPVCKKYRANRDQLVDHIEKAHSGQIPDEMSTYQYLYYLRNGKSQGTCIVCGIPTGWNTKTEKPYRICTNPECREALRKTAVNNGADGSMLKDIEHQKLMQKNKKKNIIYKFKDGGEIVCLSKDEYKLLNYLETFLELDSRDVVECPYVFDYKDGDVNRKYIPDLYLVNYNLIIEQKDDNNTNPKFLEETRYKVKLKAEAVTKDNRFNYVVVYGSKYGPLLKAMLDIKNNEINGKENKEHKKIVVHNEAVNAANQKIGEFYVGVVRLHDSFLNIFLTDTADCTRLYIGDNDGNLTSSSIYNKYFDNKNIDLYSYTGDQSILSLLLFMNGDTKYLQAIQPYEFILDTLAANSMNLYVDNNINNNDLGISDFSLIYFGPAKNVRKNEILKPKINKEVNLNAI